MEQIGDSPPHGVICQFGESEAVGYQQAHNQPTISIQRQISLPSEGGGESEGGLSVESISR